VQGIWANRLRLSQGGLSVALNSFVRRASAVLALGLVGGAIALAVGTAPASAGLGLACPSATSTPFAAWKDYANYAFAPDGGFESGGSGWSLSGGAVPSPETSRTTFTAGRTRRPCPAEGRFGYEPGNVHLAALEQDALPRPRRCRFERQDSGRLSRPALERTGIFDGGTISAGGTWKPSPALGMLGGVLPLLTTSGPFASRR
jgi:hypothetical protein